MEFLAGGELSSRLKNTIILDRENMLFYVAEIICALEDLHCKF